ncbi:MAG: UDP-galactopyranose mutase [Acetatifactor sp.]
MRYDYLIVGTGLFGAVFASEMRNAGKRCFCIDRREHIGGNIYTAEDHGIQVHRYGAHIFHTSDKRIWDYVNRYAEFNNYVNSPVAVYGDELYNLPFNMNTFSKMWGIRTPREAKEIIERQRKEAPSEPSNLEEQALSLVGRDVYEKLVKGYTEKQWGRSCTELPAFIIKRLPVRFTYDNNYFTDRYQGIPVGGYTGIVEKLLEGIPVRLGVSFREFVQSTGAKVPGRGAVNCSGELESSDRGDVFDKVLYTGMIDEYFDYCLGELQYRSLRFETELLEDCDNYQGNAVVNYTAREIPYTRIIEHKHFEFGTQPDTIITREYPAAWRRGDEPYYPINDEHNGELYRQYAALAEKEKNVLFGGRLGQYRYFDMDKIIAEALKLAESELA